MGNHLNGNGNYLHSHGNLFPQVLCSGMFIKLHAGPLPLPRCQSLLSPVCRLPKSNAFETVHPER